MGGPLERAQRISEVIRAFDAQGHHRTGTDVDNASGAWLRDLLDQQGAEAALETYLFERFAPADSSFQAGDAHFPGLPMFDAPVTPGAGVSGRLGPAGSDAEIALVVAPPGAPAPELDMARTSGRYRAVVYVTVAGRPGLAPRNAAAFPRAFGVPVLQVSGEHRARLESMADGRQEATVMATGQTVSVSASNVIGRVAGKDSKLAPFVVMTPRSGWWACASERGGGIACWLEIARAIAHEPLRRDLLLVASTGHELGHWGLERFIDSREALPTGALLWLHLGASIGAAIAPRPVLFASAPALASLTLDAMAAAGAPPVTLAPQGTVPGGESKNIHERGGRYVSFAGGSALFHLQDDRWPDAVDVAAVSAYCDACVTVLRTIDEQGG